MNAHELTTQPVKAGFARRGAASAAGILALSLLPLAAGCAEGKLTVKPTPSSQELAAPLPAASLAPAKLGGKTVTVPSPGLPLVVIRVAFQAGAIDDPPGREGLTALTADLMAAGGTQEMTAAQLLEAFFPMAAGIGVQTSEELTVFSGKVHRDHAEKFVSLLVAALAQPRWDPKEFARLQELYVQGIDKGLRESDDESLGKASLDLVMWKDHPYAHYDGGTIQGLKAATLEDCKAQAARVFSRDRMLLGVGGAVDDPILSALQSGLAALPEKGADLVALPAPKLGSPKALLVQKNAESVAVSMGYPYALRRGDPDFYPMMLAGSALGEHRQFNGRLMRALRVTRGLNYGDYAYVEHFEQAGGSTYPALNVGRRQQDFSVWLRPVTAENDLFAVRAALFQIEKFRTQGLTQQELDSTRGFLEGYTLLWQQTPMRRLGYAMDDVINGTPGFLEGFRRALPTLTVEQVNAAIRRWIHPAELRMAIVTKDAQGLRQRILQNTPSPTRYVAEKPAPEVLAEDQAFVARPLELAADQIEVQPVSEFFER
ncbi:MAG: pitrilysin family protein [Myxococcales bacterium]